MPAIERLVTELEAEHETKGTLRRGDGPYVPPEPEPTTLRFPARALLLPSGERPGQRHHPAPAGGAGRGHRDRRTAARVRRRGFADGGPEEASFNEPQGLALLDDGSVVVADTVSSRPAPPGPGHGRGDDPGGHREAVVAGLGDLRPGPRGGSLVPVGRGGLRRHGLDRDGGRPPAVDGTTGSPARWPWRRAPLTRAWSTVRPRRPGSPSPPASRPPPTGCGSPTRDQRPALGGHDGRVHTAVGTGLFDFGHRDGAADRALLQHPLGVTALPDGSVAVADTYNHALRRYDPATGEVTHARHRPARAQRRGAGRRGHRGRGVGPAPADPAAAAGGGGARGAGRPPHPAGGDGGEPRRTPADVVFRAPGGSAARTRGTAPRPVCWSPATPPELLLKGRGGGPGPVPASWS